MLHANSNPQSPIPNPFFPGSALAAATSAPAQQAQRVPHIGYVYPAGGRQGTSFEVTVGGQYLDSVTEAHISGGGIHYKVGKYRKALTQGEANKLRMKLQDAREQLQAERRAAARRSAQAIDRGRAVSDAAGFHAGRCGALPEIRESWRPPPSGHVAPANRRRGSCWKSNWPNPATGRRRTRLASPPSA